VPEEKTTFKGINVETIIKLNKFVPRSYQLPLLDALENKGYKRVIGVLPRRAGKDICAFNFCIRQCLKKVCIIYYLLPKLTQARKVIWDGIMIDGTSILSFIPPEVIANKNSQEMKIRFVNGSILQMGGSDSYDRLLGTNPYGIVYSEFSTSDPKSYQYLRPILSVSDGWALFISTPRGRNHFYNLYNFALESPDWFAYKLTIEDTKHITVEQVKKEAREDAAIDGIEGEISDEMILQEYYCDFNRGIEGSIYCKYIDKMNLNGQITHVPYQSGFPVNVAIDIGVSDATCIIWFQCIGTLVHIIDCYSNTGQGLEHYAKVIQSKDYVYGHYFAPFDISVKEWGSGQTRIEKAKELGIRFKIATRVSIEDGIESVRSAFSKIWIDEVKCKPLLKSLEAYRYEFDEKNKRYRDNPCHDWSSHYCDAMRYLAVSIHRCRDGASPEDLDKRYNEVMYGSGKLGGFFSDGPTNY